MAAGAVYSNMQMDHFYSRSIFSHSKKSIRLPSICACGKRLPRSANIPPDHRNFPFFFVFWIKCQVPILWVATNELCPFSRRPQRRDPPESTLCAGGDFFLQKTVKATSSSAFVTPLLMTYTFNMRAFYRSSFVFHLFSFWRVSNKFQTARLLCDVLLFFFNGLSFRLMCRHIKSHRGDLNRVPLAAESSATFDKNEMDQRTNSSFFFN